VLILLIFLSFATRGFRTCLPVKSSMALDVSWPEIQITTLPEIPGPLDRA